MLLAFDITSHSMQLVREGQKAALLLHFPLHINTIIMMQRWESNTQHFDNTVDACADYPRHLLEGPHSAHVRNTSMHPRLPPLPPGLHIHRGGCWTTPMDAETTRNCPGSPFNPGFFIPAVLGSRGPKHLLRRRRAVSTFWQEDRSSAARR